MKRDWDIIRQILLRLENSETPNTVVKSDEFQNLPEQEVSYNMRLLKEAGFIDASIMDSKRGDGRILVAMARRLTNQGHELLDTIRNDHVWEKIKDHFASRGFWPKPSISCTKGGDGSTRSIDRDKSDAYRPVRRAYCYCTPGS